MSLADLAGLGVFVEKRADGIDSDHLHVGVLFLEETSDAGGRAAGAQAADKMRDLALAILPDFRTGGPIMRIGIGLVFILVGIERVGNLARQLLGHGII